MLARNVLYNLIGLAAPILLALLCIPPLIAAMGTARFGLLTLVWVVLGYFSVFDLGIGRALTLAVAERKARGDVSSINAMITTGVRVTAVLGVLAAGLLAALAGLLAQLIAGDDAALMLETRHSLYLVALALPFVTVTAGLRGVLEAYGRFDLTSAIRLGMGFITYGGPLVVLQFWSGLLPVVAFLAVARVLTWLVHLLSARSAMPDKHISPRRFSSLELRPLLVSGGWMTVSNVVSPMLSYLDRFVVASVAGAQEVAYYTTPYEAVSRLTVLPEAVLGVLFPAMGAAMATDRERARRLYLQSFRVMVAVMLPIVTAVVALAHPLLSIWITPAFAAHSFVVLQLLAAGVGMNCVARVVFTVIQSLGRSDATARLHFVELPLFILLLLFLTGRYGIVGAAMAWALRATLDFAALVLMQQRMIRTPSPVRALPVVAIVAMMLAAAGVRLLHQAAVIELVLAVALVALGLLVACAWVLTGEDRALIRGAVRQMLGRRGVGQR
jgi:O-antigen/teichoic acid export membrane protein